MNLFFEFIMYMLYTLKVLIYTLKVLLSSHILHEQHLFFSIDLSCLEAQVLFNILSVF